jgi:hypothetical protein
MNYRHSRSPHHRGVPRSKRQRGRQRRAKTSFGTQVIGASALVAVAAWNLAPQLTSAWTLAVVSPEEVSAVEQSVYYRNCDAARGAGAAPIYAGQAGYREGMDGDNDGIACEPFRRW